VLAGTSTSLAEVYPKKHASSGGGGDRFLALTGDRYNTGYEVYPPFFSLRTMFNTVPEYHLKEERETEYRHAHAIPYGRPLFELMHRDSKRLDANLGHVLSKMLLGCTRDYKDDRRACMSILGTRLQLGRTDVATASDLVAKGYAHLTYFRPRHTKTNSPAVSGFSFLPDPVCARLAMCVVDEQRPVPLPSGVNDVNGGNDVNGDNGVHSGNADTERKVRGKSHKFWVGQLSSMYNDALFTPDKGSLGEQSAAFVMLLCGDVLRKRNDNTCGKTKSDDSRR